MIKECGTCGKPFRTYPTKIRQGNGKYCSKICSWTAQQGEDRRIRPDGYVQLRMPDHHRANAFGMVYEHIIVAERKLGRLLLDNEIVHHNNGNPSDNREENLTVCQSTGEHRILHYRKRIIDRGGNPDTERICHKCKRLLPLTFFSPSVKRGKKVPASKCKSCAAQYQRDRRDVRTGRISCLF